MLGSEPVSALGLERESVPGSEQVSVQVSVLGSERESVPGSELVRGLAMALEWGKSFVRVDHLESQQK